MTVGKIRLARRARDQTQVFRNQKFLYWRKSVSWHVGELCSPGSTIILIILGRFAFADIAKFPSDIAGEPFDLKE